LGMSQRHLAKRIGIGQQALSHLERREVDGTITLKALRQAAAALGAQVVYAVVPSRPLSEKLHKRAEEIARKMVGSIRHSMKLEDQEPDSDVEERVKEIVRELLASPERLWSTPDAE
jgi:predicted DNA-binding mobile mystery protein A